jgi:hypothetical protein
MPVGKYLDKYPLMLNPSTSLANCTESEIVATSVAQTVKEALAERSLATSKWHP